MKLKPMVLSAAFAMTLTGQAMASENGIVYKQAASEDSNYCHIKYMAYSEQSLKSGKPEFDSSDIIDMYGECSFDPSNPEEVSKQMSQMSRGQFGSTDNNGND